MADKKPNAYMDSMILYQKAYDLIYDRIQESMKNSDENVLSIN